MLLPANCRGRGHRAARRHRLGCRHARLARAAFAGRSGAGAQSRWAWIRRGRFRAFRTRASISSSSCPARMRSDATASWPWCRRRARCRASWRCRPRAGASGFVALSTIVEAFVAAPVHRHAGARLLPVSRHPQQRPVRRRRRGGRPAPRARGRAGAAALRRGGAARDRRQLPGRHGRVPAAAVRARRARLLSVPGPVNLNRFSAIYDMVAAAGPEVPAVHAGPGRRACSARNDLFDAIRQRDMLLHHPFQSFAPVMDLLRQAAADPDGAGDQADAVPHRRSVADRGCAGRRGAGRQGRHGHHRAARALRRGSQYRVVRRACRRRART